MNRLNKTESAVFVYCRHSLFLKDLFFQIIYCVCHAFLSVHCSPVVTCWKMANLFVLLHVMLSCVLSLSHVVWYLTVSIPDLCRLTFINNSYIRK